VFRLHVIDGIEHAQVAERLGITRSQSMNAVRRVADMMRGEVRELLRAEGVQASDLDDAVTELIALSSRRSQ
jgi:DNA-directed RNA polymerase specialized sigma24 family protein